MHIYMGYSWFKRFLNLHLVSLNKLSHQIFRCFLLPSRLLLLLGSKLSFLSWNLIFLTGNRTRIHCNFRLENLPKLMVQVWHYYFQNAGILKHFFVFFRARLFILAEVWFDCSIRPLFLVILQWNRSRVEWWPWKGIGWWSETRCRVWRLLNGLRFTLLALALS